MTMTNQRDAIAAANDLAAKVRAKMVADTADDLRRAAQSAGMPISFDDRIGEADLAKLLHMSPGTLANRRRMGNAPPHCHLPLGRHRVTYVVAAVAEWYEKQRDKAA